MSLTGEHFQRWYDQDPALSRALEQLRSSSDKYQAQVALNIIKIIVEHQMEDPAIAIQTNQLGDPDVFHQQPFYVQKDPQRYRRWYDANETLRSAMQLLHDCPEDLQRSLIPTITQMIEQTLAECFS